MPSSGFFPFPAHGEPERGSARRQSSVLAGKLFFATALAFFPCPVSTLQQIQIAAPCPVSSETGFFLQRYTSVSSIYFKIPLSFFYFEKQKRRMRAFHPPRRSDAKKFLIRLFVIQFFLGLSGQNFADMSSRPTKILKISAFRDFFVTEPKCQKGAKNRVKTSFFAKNIHFMFFIWWK